MELKKMKLQRLDITPLSDKELSKVLGGYLLEATGGGSSSAGTSSSASYSNGADTDGTADSDQDSN